MSASKRLIVSGSAGAVITAGLRLGTVPGGKLLWPFWLLGAAASGNVQEPNEVVTLGACFLFVGVCTYVILLLATRRPNRT